MSRRVPVGRGVKASGLLFPLDVIYARAGVRPPRARRVTADTVPVPYRALLDHESGLTAMLERHVGGRVDLRILSAFTNAGWYLRRVLLVQAETGRPLAMGAVRVRLGALTAWIRAQILRGAVPLGRILSSRGTDYSSRPRVFLAITPNSEMTGVFWMREPRTLYGRQTEAFHDGKKIGDIVEVLPLVS